jgi:hypothetical protein
MGEANARELAFLRARRQQILERIEAAAAAVGRDTAGISAYAVSKTVEPQVVVAAQAAGWTHFCENRPQELTRKLAYFQAHGLTPPPFDLIGHLQTNKINAVLGRAERIQSIASVKLATAVSERAVREGLLVPVLLEVNVSGEATKQGMSANEVHAAAQELQALPGLTIEGLMTMAPAGDPAAARTTFAATRELAAALEREEGLTLPELSFGMSGDFEIAVQEGATILRLGRVVFDEAYTFERCV